MATLVDAFSWTDLALWSALVVPAAAGAASLPPGARRVRRFAGIVASGGVLIAGLVLLVATRQPGRVPTTADGWLRADALSAYLLAVIGAVGLTATWGGLRRQGDEGPHPRTYAGLVSAFLTAMALTVLADNLGVMWAAIEATTITTAFLVGHHRTRHSLEAAWKYVVLGSVGVAIALLGVVVLYAAARVAGVPTLSWTVLMDAAPGLDPALVRTGAALAVLGFATKAGLAPMHSWLPDAHGQAPAPVSGLMSGVLLAVAGYAILRVQALSDAVLGPQLMRTLLATGGLLSLAVAAALLLRQRDYKRMLAYSSIEHMGLFALAAAIGTPLALAAGLLHVLGHGLAKAALFVTAGRILADTGSTRIEDVTGLLHRRPDLGLPFLAGMAALLGFPPFSLFLSEVGILLSGWQAGLGALSAAALLFLLVLFAALARLTAAMTLGPAAPSPRPRGDAGTGPATPLVLALGVTAVAGFAVPLAPVLTAAAAVLDGAR
jgi:hydrogenase-4 component F